MGKIEKFLGILLVLFLVFLVSTTFFAIQAPSLNVFRACSADLVGYQYTNKITGRTVEYVGGSTCAPTLLGFFWEKERVNTVPALPTNNNN